MAASEEINKFLKFLNNCQQDYRIAQLDVEEAEAETQDILHRLELEPDNYHTKAKLAKTLTTVRQKRRLGKRTLSELDPLIIFLGNNQMFVKYLEKVLGELRIAESRNDPKKLQYHPKTTIVHDTLNSQKKQPS